MFTPGKDISISQCYAQYDRIDQNRKARHPNRVGVKLMMFHGLTKTQGFTKLLPIKSEALSKGSHKYLQINLFSFLIHIGIISLTKINNYI